MFSMLRLMKSATAECHTQGVTAKLRPDTLASGMRCMAWRGSAKRQFP